MEVLAADNPLEGIDIDDMDKGDRVSWPAVAQGKVFLRRAIIKELGNREADFSVRYTGYGVSMEKL